MLGVAHHLDSYSADSRSNLHRFLGIFCSFVSSGSNDKLSLTGAFTLIFASGF